MDFHSYVILLEVSLIENYPPLGWHETGQNQEKVLC
jgi:hypothetical protein